MTRINVVPPAELCDQELLTERSGLVGIPHSLLDGRLKYNYDDRPFEYVVGPGNVKFFTDKLRWLYLRYQSLQKECLDRQFNVTDSFPFPVLAQNSVLWERNWNDWKPDSLALRINRVSLRATLPVDAKWTNK